MKLELKHLAPYLPYRLKAVNTYGLLVNVLPHNYINEYGDYLGLAEGCKLVLRPLSEFEYDHIVQIKEHLRIGQWCDYYDTYFDAWFDDIANIDKLVLQCPYEIMQFFLECHFDIFNLIPQGLAIDINTLNP